MKRTRKSRSRRSASDGEPAGSVSSISRGTLKTGSDTTRVCTLGQDVVDGHPQAARSPGEDLPARVRLRRVRRGGQRGRGRRRRAAGEEGRRRRQAGGGQV